MIFKGKPGTLLRITKRGNVVKLPKTIRFDKEGHFETNDKKLIKRMSGRFEKATLHKCKYGCGFTSFSVPKLMLHYKYDCEERNGDK